MNETNQESSINLPTGNFTLEELEIFLNTLSVELSFVDKDDKVRYFNKKDKDERIFVRSKGALGKNVMLCHPKKYYPAVTDVLQKFKSGASTVEEFWLEKDGKFIHLEYIAMRDKDGEYLGTLEMVQDLTEKRKLTGERRGLTEE